MNRALVPLVLSIILWFVSPREICAHACTISDWPCSSLQVRGVWLMTRFFVVSKPQGRKEGRKQARKEGGKEGRKEGGKEGTKEEKIGRKEGRKEGETRRMNEASF